MGMFRTLLLLRLFMLISLSASLLLKKETTNNGHNLLIGVVFICITDQLWNKGNETVHFSSLHVTDGTRHDRAQCSVVNVCVSVWATQCECVIDSCHLLHELAKLSAAWVAVTHVLGWCDHGTDTFSICVLCRAVDLPALLWAWVQSLQKHRDIS